MNPPPPPPPFASSRTSWLRDGALGARLAVWDLFRLGYPRALSKLAVARAGAPRTDLLEPAGLVVPLLARQKEGGVTKARQQTKKTRSTNRCENKAFIKDKKRSSLKKREEQKEMRKRYCTRTHTSKDIPPKNRLFEKRFNRKKIKGHNTKKKGGAREMTQEFFYTHRFQGKSPR